MQDDYRRSSTKELEKHIFKERRTFIKKKNNIIAIYFFDWILLTIAFLLTYLAKKGNLNIGMQYIKFYPFVFLWWIVSIQISNKFRNFDRERRRQIRLEPYFVSILFLGGMLSIQILIFGQYNMSRIIVFGNLVFYLFFEIIFLSGIYFNSFRVRKRDTGFSFFMFIFELFFIIIFVFFIPNFKGNYSINSNLLQNILFTFALLWLFNSLLVHRYRIIIDRSFIKTIYPYFKSTFTYMSFVSFLVLLFNLSDLKKILFFTIMLFAFFELSFVSVFYLKKKLKAGIEPAQDHFAIFNSWESKRIRDVIKQDEIERKKFNFPKKKFLSNFVKEKLKNIYLKDQTDVFDFIDENIGLSTIDILNAEIIDSANPYHIDIIPNESLELLINLHGFNSYKDINKYFINVHHRLKKESIFISKFEPSERRRIFYRMNYSSILGNILYTFDFLWKRAFAKLPIFKSIYNAITRGRSRVYSLAEGLGRLYYCGFELIAIKEIDNFVYFIVKKAKDPIINLTSSTGLLFSQRRVGKDGNLINVHKMRTMHPYSEFIHKYALEKGDLSKKGKIQDDFRITFWGSIFRRFWIDELPMIINFLKGEMKLIGVRPLSLTFFDIYPDDLKKLRVENKPGLIPPFYADLPTSMEEVFESERIYLNKYKKAKFRTDFSYFFKSFYNIIIKRAKSG